MFRNFAIPLVAIAAVAAPVAAKQSPQAALADLLKAERSLSEAAARMTPAEGIASVIASDGMLFTRPAPVTGPQAALAALKANPLNNGKFAKWRSVRGGVSADGQHGYTFGYLEIEGADPKAAKRRYLAYWVRGSEGWRAVAFKQALQVKDEVIVPMQPPSLPARLVAPNSAQTPSHKESLMAAEKAFSDRAQQIGLHDAFQEFGREDAINIFGPTGFRVGLKAIGNTDGGPPAQPGPASVNWSADKVFVASSGDLGVSIGEIRQNKPTAGAAGPAAPNPFFTIWRRDDPSQPWKYIAE